MRRKWHRVTLTVSSRFKLMRGSGAARCGHPRCPWLPSVDVLPLLAKAEPHQRGLLAPPSHLESFLFELSFVWLRGRSCQAAAEASGGSQWGTGKARRFCYLCPRAKSFLLTSTLRQNLFFCLCPQGKILRNNFAPGAKFCHGQMLSVDFYTVFLPGSPGWDVPDWNTNGKGWANSS